MIRIIFRASESTSHDSCIENKTILQQNRFGGVDLYRRALIKEPSRRLDTVLCLLDTMQLAEQRLTVANVPVHGVHR